MAILRREELLKFFYYLAKTLTPEELKYLKRSIPVVWKDFSHLEGPDGSYTEFEIYNLQSVYAVSFRIQEIVDARIKQHLVKERTYAEGLPKIYLAEIADTLGVDVADKNKVQLVNEILSKVVKK